MSVISMKKLLEVGVHFGHQTKCKVYNTKNNKYITLCEKDYYVLVIELLSI